MKQFKMAMAGMLVIVGLGRTGMAQTSMAPTNAPQAVAPAQKSWADSVKLTGDVRYRYETIKDDSKLGTDKQPFTEQRNRIRARIGAEGKCDDLTVGIGIATATGAAGSGNPVSLNDTLGTGESMKSIFLNYAYMDYNCFGENPDGELHAVAGKMKNPFNTMIGSASLDDLIWDPNVTPEGVALKGQIGNDFAKLYANAGYIWVQERATGNSYGDDSMLYAGQAGVKLTFIPEVALTFGGSYYDFTHLQGMDLIDYQTPASAYGNSTKAGSVSGTTTNKAWASQFTPVVCFAQLDLWIAGLPMSLFGQTLHNTDCTTSFDNGSVYGARLGKAKNPHTWELGYSYEQLDADATPGLLADSDRWGGGTDGKGHEIYGKYQFMKNLQGVVTYYMDKKTISVASKTVDYDRLQVDLVASF
jgi:hypothetical protein